MGVLLWTVAATACFLAWWTGRRRPPAGSDVVLWAGLLTTAELLDDLFLLHDAVYPMLGGRSRESSLSTGWPPSP
jgi:hypothetical protein